MKQASRYFDLVIMILVGLTGLIIAIASISSIGELISITEKLSTGKTLFIMIWLVDLLVSIGFISEFLYAIRFFRKGNSEKVSKAFLDTLTFYPALCFIASILSISFLYTLANANDVVVHLSSSVIFQTIYFLLIAIAGIILTVEKFNGKKIPYYISAPCLSASILVAFLFNVNAHQSGLDLATFILIIITLIAGIVLPLLKKFYPYEDQENNHVTTYESVNSTPINTSNDYATKLRELKKLHDEGILDDEEYRVAKERIINEL